MNPSQKQLIKRAIRAVERVERCGCIQEDPEHTRDLNKALDALRLAAAITWQAER